MNCKLIGNVYQSLEVTLDPGEEFYAQRGAMVCMDAGLQQDVQANGKGLMGMISSKLSGESLLIVRYHNPTMQSLRLVVTGHSGSLSYVKVAPGQTVILRRGDYVASNRRVNIDLNLSFNKFLTGAGFAYQKVTGDATVFFDCVDTLITRELSYGEELIIDEDHLKVLVGIDDSQITFQRNNILRNLASGEGFLVTTIHGPGRVMLSSQPHVTLSEKIMR